MIAGTISSDIGRRRGSGFDPEALTVSGAVSSKWAKGTGGPAGDECYNLVIAPLTQKPCADNESQESKLVIFQGKASASQSMNPSQTSPSLNVGKSDGMCIAIRTAQTSSNGWGIGEDGQSYTLDGAQGQAINAGMAVRRLTPLECERLQGLPDNWTAVPFNGKPASDGPRYRAIGNGMAVPVVRWIGERIQAVEDFKNSEVCQ